MTGGASGEPLKLTNMGQTKINVATVLRCDTDQGPVVHGPEPQQLLTGESMVIWYYPGLEITIT
jgi:hypothetical protein